jgi:hypothetical protein
MSCYVACDDEVKKHRSPSRALRPYWGLELLVVLKAFEYSFMGGYFLTNTIAVFVSFRKQHFSILQMHSLNDNFPY